jgi:tape measure domain-containing protein
MAQVNIQYTADISQLNSKLDQIIQKQDQLSASSKKAGDEMVSANKKAGESVDSLGNNFTRLGGLIAAAFSVSKIIEFGKSVIDTERKLELLQNRLNFVAGSAQDGQKLFQRLASASKELGINIEVLAEGMASFGISATQAGFSASKAEQIFLKMSAGLRAAGATSLQAQRAFFALQQMIDKGVVSAEELRRQLAEALPGATSLMVRAYNNLHPAQQVTMDQFIKLQEAGKILSRDILPEFANVIEQEFAPALAGKKASLDAALDRVNTQFTLLKANIADSKLIKNVASTISTELERLNAILTSNFTAMEKASMALNLLTSSRNAAIIIADELIAAEQKVVEVQKKISEEGIENAKKINLLKGEERQKAIKDLNLQKIVFEEMVKAGTATKEQIRSLERIKATQQELFDLEALAASMNKDNDEQRKKEQEQRLKDEVALAKIRVEQAQKGSIEENAARANLAEKQGALDSFMAKSSAEMQLARVIAEKKANEQIEESRRKTEDALSQNVVEDDIDPSKDPNLKAIDKTLETYRKNKDKISEGIAAPFMDAMQKEMLAATNHYLELIKLTEENSEERKQLEEALQKELDNIREKAAEKDAARRRRMVQDQIREVQEITNAFSVFFSSRLELEAETAQSALKNLEQKFNKGLISEREYEEQKLKLQKEAFEREKSLQIARAIMSGANAVLSILGNPTTAVLAPILIPLALGTTATQLSIIESQTPGFKEGIIGLNGPGTETSDSILARLSKGESVMTAAETRKHKDVLEAIRHDRLPSLIAEKYIIPAYKDSMDKPRKAASDVTSMEAAFQTAELVQAIKGNKKIKIANVDEFSRAINSKSTSEYMARRRKW